MFKNLTKYQKNRLMATLFFLLFAIIVSIFQYFQNSENFVTQNTENFSQTENDYISTLQTETKAKVLKILDDAEVQKTLERIKNSDEFYNKDGAIFLNREKKLPIKKDKEYYAEWTVKTPWESTRWAKRIVAWKWGEMYFTDDHYRTFLRIQ